MTAEKDLPADEARRRATALLEQAFDTHAVNVGDPWCSAPEIRSVLPDEERTRYINAAQAYALLALSTPAERNDDDACKCGHDHGVSVTTCDRCYWCQGHTIPAGQ